jgi:2-succinyl-5-enolpyruvyl-6-hydroxy-3-cyclohexene-1-carboxylate synthase
VTNVQATFAATLVDEWERCGVRHAVLAPGSRSTPLALALLAGTGIAVHVHHDERAAAFMALGIGKASGSPAVLLCTSGTAAAELHASVIEAHQARVPMLVCTADRPPELQSVGAPQTIDQTHLYGGAVRWFTEPGVADDATRGTWRSLAARAYIESVGRVPGPVHLNLAFRDPLVGEAGELPDGRAGGAPWHLPPDPSRRHAGIDPRVLDLLGTPRGVIVAGAGAGAGVTSDASTDLVLQRITERTGWPVLADPTSRWRVPGTIGAFDGILRAVQPAPEVVVRLGEPPASKVLAQWLAGLDCPQIAVSRGGWPDPDRTAAVMLDEHPTLWALATLTTPHRGDDLDPTWLAWWRDAEAAAQRAIDEVLATKAELTEPFVARTVAAHASTLVVSSSMPVRDVEWYAAPRDGLRVHANRGANGIDGVVSTAIGVAIASGEPVTVLVGDIAFLHDTNALLGLAERDVDVTVVVVDNRGGGIFSFLPQADELDAGAFERLFGTPHDVDLAGLAAVHGLPAMRVHEPDGLASALQIASAAPGSHVVIAPTDRHSNVAVHDEIHAAVAAALRSRR